MSHLRREDKVFRELYSRSVDNASREEDMAHCTLLQRSNACLLSWQMTSKMGDLREKRAVTGRLCHGEEGGTTMGTKKCEVEIEGEVRLCVCLCVCVCGREGSGTLTTSCVESVPPFIASQLICAHCSLRSGASGTLN